MSPQPLRRLPFVLCAALIARTAAAQTPATRPTIDFSGVIFGNYQMRTDDAARAATGGKPFGKFEIERVHLLFRMPLGDRSSARVMTDIFQNTSDGYYGGWVVRLKHAYFQYDASKRLFGVQGLAAAARVGMLQTVVPDHIEGFWPRWLTNVALERNGFMAPNDLGASSLITFPDRRGEAYVTITNGSGYTSAETDRFKDVAARLSLTPFANDSSWLRTLTFSPWYYAGASASQFVLGGASQNGAVSDGLQKDRRGIFVGVREHAFTAGAEFAQRLDGVESGANTRASPRTIASRTSRLVDGFVIARPLELARGTPSRLAFVARVDRFTLDASQPPSPANPATTFTVFGLFWDLTSRASFSVDVQRLTPRDGATVAEQRTVFLHWTASF